MAERRLGGYPEGARPAGAVPGSEVKGSVTQTRSAVVKSGGVPYAPTQCPKLKANDEACQGTPTESGLCASHQRAADRA